MTNVLTNRERNELFDQLIEDVGKKWLEFLRKLGMPENLIMDQNTTKHAMLNQWVMKMGALDVNRKQLIKKVKHEVFNADERNRDVDSGLESKLAKNRDRAFLLYGFAKTYYGPQWDDIVRNKFEMDSNALHNINVDHEANQEKQYQTLLHWIQKEGFETNYEIGDKLKSWNLVVSQEYTTAMGTQSERS
uniref:Phosphoinositide 3-kinase adapter protein 1-like n=1 Tax=Phallusia mammillata TaxID=59560 RepID=A0A6F9DPH1_9ASCI|nr:phosphoinositide 3-kinase adapter protein 1-like [Phallusia mammillata]